MILNDYTQIHYRYLKAMSRSTTLNIRQLTLILEGHCVGISAEKVAQLKPSLIRLHSYDDLKTTPPINRNVYSRGLFWIPFRCYFDMSVFALGFDKEQLIRLVLTEADKDCVYIFGVAEKSFNSHLRKSREQTRIAAIKNYTNKIKTNYGKRD